MTGSFAEALLKSPITHVIKSQMVSLGVAFLRRAQCPAEAYSSPVIREVLLDFSYSLGSEGQNPRER